jgi:hypothetical protein
MHMLRRACVETVGMRSVPGARGCNPAQPLADALQLCHVRRLHLLLGSVCEWVVGE